MAAHKPISASESDAAKFRTLINRTSSCWLWVGALDACGYGVFRGFRAHRVSWVLANGRQIPPGLTLDHLCRVRACVNPAHLEPVTNRENVMRGESRAARRRRSTHCLHGHLFTPENTLVRYNDERRCRTCENLHHRRKRVNHKLRRASS